MFTRLTRATPWFTASLAMIQIYRPSPSTTTSTSNRPPGKLSRGTPTRLFLRSRAIPILVEAQRTIRGLHSRHSMEHVRLLMHACQSTSVFFGNLKKKSGHQTSKRSSQALLLTCALTRSLSQTPFGCRGIDPQVQPGCEVCLGLF